MKRFFGLLIASSLMMVCNARAADKDVLKTIWTIGSDNGGYTEFSQKPAKAWLDKYAADYAGGFDFRAREKIAINTFPAAVPGLSTPWGEGKEYPVRVRFELKKSAPGGYLLTVGIAGAAPDGDASLRVSTGAFKNILAIKKGSNSEPIDSLIKSELRQYFISIPADAFSEGENTIELTLGEGQWIIYDFIRLEAIVDPAATIVKNFKALSPPFLAACAGGKGYCHVLRASFASAGKPRPAFLNISIGGESISKIIKLGGEGGVEIQVPEVSAPVDAKLTIESEGETLASAAAPILPVKHLSITLMPESHLDIGYPDIQPNIVLGQRFFLERALDLIEETSSAEEIKTGSAMRWTAESAWPEWLLFSNRDVYEEYGRWIGDVPIMNNVPMSFWKEISSMRDTASKATVTSSAGADDENNRRAVDGSKMAWASRGPAGSAWINLEFPQPRKIKYTAVRNSRDTADNPIVSVRVSAVLADGSRTSEVAGPMGANFERLLLKMSGKPLKSIRVDVTAAKDNSKQVGFMEIETWEDQPKSATTERMLRAIKNGRLEITGMNMNFLTELTTTEWLARSMMRAEELARASGVPVRSALMTDVPGFSFALPDIFESAGIKYFYPAINPDHAGGSQRDMPRAFFWEGPGGGRVMVFRSFDSYFWEGLGSKFHLDADLVEENLPNFLGKIEKDNYPHDRLIVRMQGDYTDDGPTAERLPRVVAEWNRRWVYPKVTIGTPTEFFDGFAEKYANSLPTLRGDWTAYWEDGAGSTALETTYVRAAHRDILLAGAFNSFREKMFGPDKTASAALADAEENIYLYDEHTWGADESIFRPDTLHTTGQWKLKQAPAWSAMNTARSLPGVKPLVDKLAPSPSRGGKIFAAISGSGSTRSGKASAPLSAGALSADVFDAATGKRIESATTKTQKGREVAFIAGDVPAFGMKFYEIVEKKTEARAKKASFSGTLENRYYRIEIDSATGQLKSVFDKEANKELVDSARGYGMNEFVYLHGSAGEDIFRLENARVEGGDDNFMYTEIVISGKAKNFPAVSQIVRLYHGEKKIEFENRLRKNKTREKEALFFAFPFGVGGGEMRFDMTGGVMALEKDQLSGACRDWISAQDGLGVVSQEFSALLAMPDAPLVAPEKIQVMGGGRNPKTTAAFSYVMNNYWHTNYMAEQGGDFVFRYAVTSRAGAAPDSEMIRFGQETAEPVKLIAANGRGGKTGATKSFLRLLNSNARILGVKPAQFDGGLIVRVQEMDGKAAKIKLETDSALGYSEAWSTTITERNINKIATKKTAAALVVETDIKPRAIITIRLK